MRKRDISLSAAIIIAMIIGTMFVLKIAVSEKAAQVKPAQAKAIEMPTSAAIEAELNKFRVERDLPALYADNHVLDQAAQARAEQMCADSDWSHDKAWEILDPVYAYAHASENLYYDYLSEDFAQRTIEGWAISEGHRENMLKDHQEIGVGVKSCPGFQGYDTAVIVTSYFGVPR